MQTTIPALERDLANAFRTITRLHEAAYILDLMQLADDTTGIMAWLGDYQEALAKLRGSQRTPDCAQLKDRLLPF